MWVLADVVGLFSINPGPFSRNVGRRGRIFSANVVPNRVMLSGRGIYVLRSPQLASGFALDVRLVTYGSPSANTLELVREFR
jgi:hypothetical protein